MNRFLPQRKNGFTIVELLIVIVVISILAAISIVAYNGIQSRAENTKTIQAAASWAKAIKMHHIDTGIWPTQNSCLGNTSTYPGPDTRCWPSSTWIVRQNFLDALQPYIGSIYPEPSSKNINDVDPYKGAMYYINGSGEPFIYIQLLNTTSCPSVSGLGDAYGAANRTSGRSCYYRL